MSTKIEEEETTAKTNSIQGFSVDLLKLYYGRLFPYEAMFRWLSYGNDPNSDSAGIDKDFFSHREWSFTIQDDIYIRYQSFRDQEEMIAAIRKRQPHKIDIGAVFNACPKDHTSYKPEQFHPEERELVFDIDMTDYDDIRVCCKGADICGRCWPYMNMAIKVVDSALREDFDFKHILWIYSGRRGVHCWVCDPAARSLSNEARTAVVDYLSVHTSTAGQAAGEQNTDKKLKQNFTSNMHPMMKRAYEQLEPYFCKNIADRNEKAEYGQGLLTKKEYYMKILNSLPNEEIRKELYHHWENHPEESGAERWEQMKELTTEGGNSSNNNSRKKRINYAELIAWRTELVFTHCYPRLDANVSKTQNHLLKAPFCVHPKTGRVCIPIDARNADAFEPAKVPTLGKLCEEIDRYSAAHEDGKDEGNNGGVSDLEKTSLKAAVDFFQTHFLKDLFTTIRKEMRDRVDQKAAMMGDF